MSLSVSLNMWTQRFNVTISWQEEELVLASEQQLHRALEERGHEMALAIEERDLQKMAALSQQDSEKDQLQQVINQLQQVVLEDMKNIAFGPACPQAIFFLFSGCH